jgi:acyl carrier protein
MQPGLRAITAAVAVAVAVWVAVMAAVAGIERFSRQGIGRPRHRFLMLLAERGWAWLTANLPDVRWLKTVVGFFAPFSDTFRIAVRQDHAQTRAMSRTDLDAARRPDYRDPAGPSQRRAREPVGLRLRSFLSSRGPRMMQQISDVFDTDPRVNQILDIVARETAIDRTALRPQATIEELGIPSLDLTLAVFQLESFFDVEIPVIGSRPGSEFETVGELVGHVIATLDKAATDQSGFDKLLQPGQPALEP